MISTVIELESPALSEVLTAFSVINIIKIKCLILMLEKITAKSRHKTNISNWDTKGIVFKCLL